MPVRHEKQLEKCIDDATRKNDFQALEQFLEADFSDGFSHKCSKLFLNKVDKLICQRLENEDVKNVSTLLNILQKHGRNINILGKDGFPAMIEYGLVQKAKEIIENKINEKYDEFTTLIDDFFEVIMIIHDTSSEGKTQILENFMLRTCSLAADKRMNIYIQQEAVRKLNSMLNAVPRDTRKKIISTKEMLHVMNDMGKRILDAGDYDLQVAITEALCRMTSEKQRGELANQWFSMEFVSNAFKGIKDSEFETDCRKFLNQVNGMLGDKRRVFTYPCLSAILDKHELQIPVDDNLEEFWIDFNTGSRSISFYVAADDEGHQWETVSIPEEEVEIYIIEEKDKKMLLTITLKNPMVVGDREGEKIILHFDSALKIVDAVRNVYGANKCQGFMRKNTMSVAKTTVHVIFDESGSQVLVPESQISPLKEKTCELLEEKDQHAQIHKDLNEKDNTVPFQTVQSKITPGKRKVSEASMIVPCTARLSIKSPLPLVNTSTPRKGRLKMPLEMMTSTDKANIFSVPERRTMKFSVVDDDDVSVSSITKSLKKNNCAAKKYIPIEKVPATMHNEEDLDTCDKGKLDELTDIVPDSQPVGRNDKPLLPGILENSVVEIKTQKKQMCWVPEKIISHFKKQNTSALGAPNVSDRAAKQKAFASIFKTTSPELSNKLQCHGEIVEQQQNEINKIPVKNSKISSTESQNSFIRLDEEISKNSSINIVPIKSEISLNATRMNDRSLVNLKHSELVVESNNEAGFDVSSSRNKATNKKTDQKGKSKEVVEAAEILISKISDRYKPRDGAKSMRKLCQSFSSVRPSLNKSSFSATKRKSENKSSRHLKTATLLNITTKHLTDDVYDFHLSGCDDPTIKLGIQELHVTKLEATTNLTNKMNQEGKSTTQKKQDKKDTKNKNKQHLFSDTDTEYRGDETKTDISWLRESNRKPKPQVIDYSRTRKQKKPKSGEANKCPVSSAKREMPQQKKTKTNKVPVPENPNNKNAGEKVQHTRSKQPRRAALAKKCYKERSDSETESEVEYSVPLIKKNTVKDHPEHKGIKSKSKIQQNIVSNDAVKAKSVNQEKKLIKSKYGVPKSKIELSPMPSSESPASVEIMRCSRKSTEEESTQEHISVRRSLSSFLQELTPEREESSCNIKRIAALVKTNEESAQLKQPPEKCIKPMSENESLSPVSSPLSLTNLTPFTKSKKFSSDQQAEYVEPEDKIYGADEIASVKNYSLDRSSDTEVKDVSENCMENRREGSVSQLSTPSISREELWHKEPHTHIHESGPTIHPNFKRLYQDDTGSDSDDMEIKKDERKTKLLPRKLFKADDSTHKVSESISTLSINDASAFDGEGWDADSSSVGMICQKLHKELARKMQSRAKRMDSFTKQSLKATHQHMNAVNTELHEHRTKELQHFHSCIIKELENFEKDSLVLKSMEKEFLNFSKKHSQIFNDYHKNEQERLQNLKTSFEKNIYRTADCEENIFTSEMHLMREDMRGLQERLLKEMHEEELLNVRRGLQSLFMKKDGKF